MADHANRGALDWNALALRGKERSYFRSHFKPEATVGGVGDCWKACFQLEYNDVDAPMPLLDFLVALINAIKVTLGPGCDTPPTFEIPEGFCAGCYIPREECGCEEMELPPMKTPFEDALSDYWLKIRAIEGGLHLHGYRWKSASRQNTKGYMRLGSVIHGMLGTDEGALRRVLGEKVVASQFLADTLVGLTSVFVLGTIGDVQPAVETASVCYAEAQMEMAAERQGQAFFAAGVDAQWVQENDGVVQHSLVPWDPSLAFLLAPIFLTSRSVVACRAGFLSQFTPCPWVV
jgi:hypothetical protein